ncbi:noggin [Elysia marginata]|uniref:Noggin n=1 Tax=Elysia marginata TaxID=1093978 RepID=A0AAV4HR74_9GAST|nr:noggin [Elysia marginata]
MLFVEFLLKMGLVLVALGAPNGAHASRELFRKMRRNNGFMGGSRKMPSRGLRPVSSDDLPIEPLIENPSSMYDPKPEDLNIKKLREQIGSQFDRKFMSVRDPRRRRNKSLTKITRPPALRGRGKGGKGSKKGLGGTNRKRPSFLRLLRSARLQDGSKIRLDVSKRERRIFQKYMWNLTFCPVKFTWRELSNRFWPRWIREGSCVNRRSCSVPAGMTCKPSQFVYKTFLRWVCNPARRKTCKWVNISYPIITECSCQCNQ